MPFIAIIAAFCTPELQSTKPPSLNRVLRNRVAAAEECDATKASFIFFSPAQKNLPYIYKHITGDIFCGGHYTIITR